MPDTEKMLAGADWSFDLSWKQIRGVVEQLEEEQIHKPAFPNANTIAGIIQHLCYSQLRLIGNKVGGDPIPPEAPADHSRDFKAGERTRADLAALIDRAEASRRNVFAKLNEAALGEPGFQWPGMSEPATKWETIQRVLAHVGHHRGQIVMLARWLQETGGEAAAG